MNRSRRTTVRMLGIGAPSTLALVLAACGTAAPAATQTPTADPATMAASPSRAEEATSDPATPSRPDDEQATEQVRIVSSTYMPGTLAIPVGTRVVFANEDSYAHTVTHGTDGQATDDAFVDETVDANAEVTVTFDEAGTFPITCRFHPAMQMEVVVEG